MRIICFERIAVQINGFMLYIHLPASPTFMVLHFRFIAKYLFVCSEI